MTPVILAARDVTFRWRTGVALRGINVVFQQGEMVAVAGPNGAGKSTLLRVLTGYLRPAEGEVLLAGSPILSYSRRRAAREIAFMPQYADVNLPFTVEELATLARYSYLGAFGRPGPDDRAAVRRALALTGVLDLAGRRVSELSGGEYQRAALARALAQCPQVLLLDEPTAHLDISQQGRMFSLLKSLNQSEGLTVIAAVHDLNIASYYFPRVTLMAGGSIVDDGPAAEVLTDDKLSAVYDCRILTYRTPDRRLIYADG